MYKLLAASTALASILSSGTSPAAGQLPGYELIRLTETPLEEGQVTLNNIRQIAYMAREGFNNSTMEIYLFDDNTGQTIQITDNSIQDLNPGLNNDGVLVWSSVMGQTPQGDPTAAIMVRTPDGVITQLTDGDLTYDRNPVVNIHGQIAWVRWDRRGCGRSARNIMFFDGQTIRRITDNDLTNQQLSMNDDAVMIWAEFDVCAGGGNWRSLIKLYQDGEITTLSRPGLQAKSTTLNNHGVAAWRFSDPSSSDEGIVVWEDGATRLLTDWGHGPELSDAGDMFFLRWHQSSGTWQAWMYLNQRFHQLTDDPFWNAGGDINGLAEVCWSAGPLGETDIWYMRRLPLGDLDCDGSVDALDIEGFLQAMFDPENFPPDCDPTLADINQDGSVDSLDIEPFIALLFP